MIETSNKQNLHGKNIQLFFYAFILSLFFSNASFSQINKKALFNAIPADSTTNTPKTEQPRKKAEYQPVNEQPVNSLEIKQPAQTPAQQAHVQRVITSQPRANKANNTANNDHSILLLVERALQDTTGIILLSEEELPPADMPDSVYIRRLSALPSIISLPYNSIVRNYIIYYMQKYPKQSESILGLCNYYLPIFEEILDKYDIPLEMRALPIVESALNPVAVSRSAATGMWQFMLPTARRYGLAVNTYVDERRDFVASTHAAAQYLTFLYSMFQDWTLALAAYNCGEGTVQRAIFRAGGKRDYWEIYPYLPKETRNYVPLFIAANYLTTYYKEHRLTPRDVSFPTEIDTFMVNSHLHFEQISKTINLPMNVLRELNPQYKRDVIPGNEKSYELRIPSEFTYAFIENEREIYSKGGKYFKSDIVVNPVMTKDSDKPKAKAKSESAQNSSTQNSTVESNEEQTIHKVAAGESLGIIAGKYGLKVSDLCSWNNLKNTSTIYPGQKLTIYKKTKATENKTTENKANTAENKPKQPKSYTIQSGDNFWAISQKHNVNLDELLEINNMTKNSKLIPGQKIMIPNK